MMLARKTWRPLAVALLLMVMTLVMGAMAMAEDDPVSFTIQISPDALTSPGDVSVSLRVSNSSDQDMVDPVPIGIQLVIHVQDRTARIAEDGIHPLLQQAFQKDFRTVQKHVVPRSHK